MQHRTIIRVMLIGVAALGAWTAAELADDTAAHADVKLPAVVAEQPGGPLDHHLPERASGRAKQVVDQVAPDKPATAKPKPRAHKPKPPAVKPAPKPEPTEPAKPAEPKPRPDVELPAVVPPAADEPTPNPAPAPGNVVTLPANDLPTLAAVVVPAPVIAPAPLPALIGPTPTEPPPAGIIAQLITSLTAAAEPHQPAHCADDPDDAVNVNRDAIRALLAILTGPATNTRATPAHGCPGTPGNPLPHPADCAGTTATSNTTTTHGALAAELAGALTAPALTRLHHARPRSTIPAGRHVAVEPGPA